MLRNLPREHKSIYRSVLEDAKPNVYFFVMVILSCTVATYGLLSNSTAVVIGAMLIAPLMEPILGGALAIASGSNNLLKLSIRAEALGAVLAVILSALLTLVLPNAELTAEVLARTTPTIVDLIIALAAGAAGTYAILAKPQSATLPGVAIATALMPPLCVVGIGLAKHDFVVMTGALLLFLANMIAINVAAIAMFELAGFSAEFCLEESQENLCNNTKRRIWLPVILLVLISIPLAYIMYRTYTSANTEKIVRTTIIESLSTIAPNAHMISTNYKLADDVYKVETSFRATRIITPEHVRQMENVLELRLGKPVKMEANVTLTQKLDNKTNIIPFRDLLPQVKEEKIVEIVKAGTPEEIIEEVIAEKISLVKGAVFEDFSLQYRRGSATYIVSITLSGVSNIDEQLAKSVPSVLEERLKRRVEVKIILNKPAAKTGN